MIINQNNKDFILKGSMKRGFNQTPNELKERLLNQNPKEILSNQNTNEDKQTESKDNLMEEYFKAKKARNELKRF